MVYGVFAISLECKDRVVTLKEKLEGITYSDALNHFTDFKKCNQFFTPFEAKLGPVGSGQKPSSFDFIRTEWIAFDIDGIEPSQYRARELPVEILEKFLPLDEHGERHYVWTGHGIQAHYRIPQQNKSFFSADNSIRYKKLCEKISNEFLRNGLIFKEIDSRVFEPSRVLRLPGTVNHKAGQAPVRSELIESVNDSSGIANSSFLEFFVSQEATKRSARPTDTGKVKDFLVSRGAIDHGAYALMCCPWHSESKPSFAFYYDSEIGYDFHLQRTEWNYARTLKEVFDKITENDQPRDECEDKKAVYREQFGLESFSPADEIVKAYLSEKRPKYRCKSGIYFSDSHKPQSMTSAQSIYNREILEKIIASSDEYPDCRQTYSKKITDFDVAIKIFKQYFPIAWDKLIGELPEQLIVSDDRATTKKEVVRWLCEMFNRQQKYSVTVGGERQHIEYSSIMAQSFNAPDRWVRFGTFQIFLRVAGNPLTDDITTRYVGIRFSAIKEFHERLYNSFSSPKDFALRLKRYGIGEVKTIKTEGKSFRVVEIDLTNFEEKSDAF